MCDNGSVILHLERTLSDAKNTILLTGYQSKGSNGHILSELSQMDEKQKSKCYIQLGKNSMKATSVKANICKIGGYFGHADQKSLINYLFTDEKDKHFTVPNIFLNHGDNYARETLKNAIYSYCGLLQEKYEDTSLYQTNVEIPKLDNKFYDLDRQLWIDNDMHIEQLLQVLNRSSLA